MAYFRSYHRRHYGGFRRHYGGYHRRRYYGGSRSYGRSYRRGRGYRRCPSGSMRVAGKCRVYPSKDAAMEIRKWPTAKRYRKGCACGGGSVKSESVGLGGHKTAGTQTTAGSLGGANETAPHGHASKRASEAAQALKVVKQARTDPIGTALDMGIQGASHIHF